jgi:hypothetical protein
MKYIQVVSDHHEKVSLDRFANCCKILPNSNRQRPLKNETVTRVDTAYTSQPFHAGRNICHGSIWPHVHRTRREFFGGRFGLGMFDNLCSARYHHHHCFRTHSHEDLDYEILRSI